MNDVLDVPLKLQPDGSADCGPTCVSMILEYYGITNNAEEITKEIRHMDKNMILPDDSYTYTPQLGLYLLKKGFEVEIVTFNPFIFMHKDRLTKDPMKSLLALYDRVKDNPEVDIEIKRPAKFFVDFVENGGKITVKVPDKNDIRSEISEKRPLISLLTTHFLYDDVERSVFNFHANVITGIDKDFIYVNDPISGVNRGRMKHLIDEYIFGLHASAYGAPDNASLIKIKK